MGKNKNKKNSTKKSKSKKPAAAINEPQPQVEATQLDAYTSNETGESSKSRILDGRVQKRYHGVSAAVHTQRRVHISPVNTCQCLGTNATIIRIPYRLKAKRGSKNDYQKRMCSNVWP